jgi:uncharacterized membrane protein
VDFHQILLILHFIGLAMGFSVSFANMVMGGLAAKSAPADQAVLARFPPAMSRVGDVGLILLWATGLTLLFTYWGGTDAFSVLPWQFHVKLTGVVILTGLVGYVHSLMRKARMGDAAAARTIPTVGKIAFVVALTIVVMAVWTFN